MRARCLDCGNEAEAADVLAICPACGGLDLETTGGDELILEAIHLDEGPGGSSSEAMAPGSEGEDDVSRHPG